MTEIYEEPFSEEENLLRGKWSFEDWSVHLLKTIPMVWNDPKQKAFFKTNPSLFLYKEFDYRTPFGLKIKVKDFLEAKTEYSLEADMECLLQLAKVYQDSENNWKRIKPPEEISNPQEYLTAYYPQSVVFHVFQQSLLKLPDDMDIPNLAYSIENATDQKTFQKLVEYIIRNNFLAYSRISLLEANNLLKNLFVVPAKYTKEIYPLNTNSFAEILDNGEALCATLVKLFWEIGKQTTKLLLDEKSGKESGKQIFQDELNKIRLLREIFGSESTQMMLLSYLNTYYYLLPPAPPIPPEPPFCISLEGALANLTVMADDHEIEISRETIEKFLKLQVNENKVPLKNRETIKTNRSKLRSLIKDVMGEYREEAISLLDETIKESRSKNNFVELFFALLAKAALTAPEASRESDQKWLLLEVETYPDVTFTLPKFWKHFLLPLIYRHLDQVVYPDKVKQQEMSLFVKQQLPVLQHKIGYDQLFKERERLLASLQKSQEEAIKPKEDPNPSDADSKPQYVLPIIFHNHENKHYTIAYRPQEGDQDLVQLDIIVSEELHQNINYPCSAFWPLSQQKDSFWYTQKEAKIPLPVAVKYFGDLVGNYHTPHNPKSTKEGALHIFGKDLVQAIAGEIVIVIPPKPPIDFLQASTLAQYSATGKMYPQT